MKKIITFLFVCLVVQNLFAVQMQQTVTDPEKGLEVMEIEGEPANQVIPESSVNSRDNRLGILWQTSDTGAIAGEIEVSDVTQNSFVQWHLNNERVSLFHDSAVPLWEHTVGNLDFGFPIEMTEDGSILAVGDESTLKIFEPSSSTPTWQYVVTGSIKKMVLNSDGSIVFMAVYDEGQGTTSVESYNVGNTTPLWTNSFDGSAGNLVISGDGSTLVFTQYGGISAMWVLNAADGSIIFEGPEYNQNPPAMSYDASIIVNGDYSG